MFKQNTMIYTRQNIGEFLSNEIAYENVDHIPYYIEKFYTLKKQHKLNINYAHDLQNAAISHVFSNDIQIADNILIDCNDEGAYLEHNTIDHQEQLAEKYFPYNINSNGTLKQCKYCTQGKALEDLQKPFNNKMPVLILPGEYDANLPEILAKNTAAQLQNALYYIINGAQHAMTCGNGDGCVKALLTTFIDTPTQLLIYPV